MSLAGVRSSRGDEYQVQVALDWIVRLLMDDEVLSVQVESLGIDGEVPPSVDDVVVRLVDRTIYVQAKKNHPARNVWSLSDPVLQAELVKGRGQLEADSDGEVWIYSQSPFGRFEQLCDEAPYYPDHTAFSADVPQTLLDSLRRFAEVIDRDAPTAFNLVRRIRVKRTLDFDDWEATVRRDLRMRFARPDDVLYLLHRLIDRQQARLGAGPRIDPGAPITRAGLDALLRERGHVPAPNRPTSELLATFRQASQQGRSWKRDVDGQRFVRREVDEVAAELAAGARSVVVTSGPGGGKTCVLLDLVDQLEGDDTWIILFIKGDQYDGARTRGDLADRGLPGDIVGHASRLSVSYRVAIVVDALDVLSLQRESGTLKLFLGIIDELGTLDRVSVVAACRDFDLEYAPELRDREWDSRIRLGLLSQEVVDELLRTWSVEPECVDEPLRGLLKVPQHLRLFGQLVQSGVTEVAAGPYALHERFLEVVVEQGDGLGAPGMLALYDLADRLQKERRLTLPRSAFPGDPALVRQLLSAEVLIEPQLGTISFSHQELLDCVAVRGSVRRGQNLSSFLSSRPALPFVRPTARTFMFMLRAQDPEEFRRQVRRALDAEGIAYHLRRLIAESIGEVVPEVADRQLLHWLLRRHPDLFERAASRLKDRQWLEHVQALLEAVLASDQSERWTGRLLRLMSNWAAAEPAAVIGAWRDALDQHWPGVGRAEWEAARAVRSALKELPEGAHPPAVIGQVITLLLNLPDPQGHLRYDLAPVVEQWVTAVDGDDDFIQLVLERALGPDANDLGSLEFKGSFLEDRMAASDSLMEWALEMLKEEVASDERARWRDLLDATTFSRRHASGMSAATSDRMALTTAFEGALVRRAERADAWWLAREVQFISHDNWAFRYLAMRGYQAAPEGHARAIASFVVRAVVLGDRRFASEVRELAHAGYPYFDNDEREAHQRAVLAEYEAGEETVWRAQQTFGHLIWVPAPWRTPEAHAFLQTWETTFPPWRPGPDITSTGGSVPPPFGSDQLLALSDDEAVRLALFFGTEGGMQTDGWGNLIGGWDQAVGIYRDAASRAPSRMAALLTCLIDRGVAAAYLDAVVDGLGLFLRLQFGTLNNDGWGPAEDHADGEAPGREVLGLLERFGASGFRAGSSDAQTWQEDGALRLSERAAADVAQGCAAVLTQPDDLGRLAVLLDRLSTSQDPQPNAGGGASFVALNSVRGQVAQTAVQVAGTLLRQGAALPAVVPPLLIRLAKDPVPGVRASLLDVLPYFTQFDRDRGWELAEQALAAQGTEVWERGERMLYHNYYNDYAHVAPYLDVLRSSDLAPETFGRISMLCGLAGHLDAETVIADLVDEAAGAWKGVTQVLMANVPNPSTRGKCVALLGRIIVETVPPQAAVQTVVYGMDEDVRPHVPRRLVERLIELRNDEHGFRFARVAEWIEMEAVRNPTSASEVLWLFAAALERSSAPWFYGPSDELGRALNAVLRDADESDNPETVHTAVELQDKLTRLNAIDADDLFEASARR